LYGAMEPSAICSGLLARPIAMYVLLNRPRLLEPLCAPCSGSLMLCPQVSAPPGFSEHHTGYALDIGDASEPRTHLESVRILYQMGWFVSVLFCMCYVFVRPITGLQLRFVSKFEGVAKSLLHPGAEHDCICGGAWGPASCDLSWLFAFTLCSVSLWRCIRLAWQSQILTNTEAFHWLQTNANRSVSPPLQLPSLRLHSCSSLSVPTPVHPSQHSTLTPANERGQ